jgi:hypothetical protein
VENTVEIPALDTYLNSKRSILLAFLRGESRRSAIFALLFVIAT